MTVRSQSTETHPASPHSLLWRITGKGLQKPSYLYGTMHLNDKRLFNFDDSVYRAIEKTQGLAIEVNPDEMAAYFVNELFDQLENGKKLQDVLDKQYFTNNRKALARKFNKPAEEISASDVVKEKNKWMTDYMEKGEMPTFMDAYLYNIARRQGKWLGGIEDITDQTGLLADMIDKADINYLLATDSSVRRSDSRGSLETMIDLYLKQDIDGIEAFSTEHSTAEQKDELLIRRNLKMARRIDSLIGQRTMFLAIGAAHLPGDSGVISMLRQKGYTLEPVFSNKKIASSDYTFEEVRLPWMAVTDEQGYYTAEMPANPATVKLYGLIEMKFLLDLFNLSGFCTMAVANSSHISSRDSLFNGTAQRMFRGDKVLPVRSLEKNGVMGKEYIHIVKGENLRVQLFADDKMVYIAMFSSFRKDSLHSADADKFFQSFTINPGKEQTPAVTSTFTDSVMGIAFSTPARLSYNARLSSRKDEAWKISCFTGADPSADAYIMLFSKEVKPGYHIPDDNEIHDDFFTLMKTQYSGLSKDSTILDGAKLVKVTGRNTTQPNIFMNAISIVRNGRHILLMAISDSSTLNSGSMRSVFGSFHFIAHPVIEWQQYASPDSTFRVYGPSPVRSHFYQDGNQTQWVSYDTTTATSYLVIPDTLEKYTWYASDSLFWVARLGGDTASENLLEIRDVVNGDLRGKEFMIKNAKNALLCSRTRLLVTGDKIYKLSAAGERGLLHSAKVDAFFNEFRVIGPTSPSTACVSKAALLLRDLGSMDSATRRDAYSALTSAHFSKGDTKLLREAVFRLYQSPFDTTRETTINRSIARKLADLDDSTTVTYTRDTYPSLVKERQSLQNIALYLLASQHTAPSYALLKELLQRGPTTERLGFSDLYVIKDSLALAVSLFPALRSWIKDTLQAPAVASVALSLLDSGYLSKEALMPSAGAFVDAAVALLPALKTSEDYSDYNLFSLIKLIGRFHTPASYSLLKEYLAVKSKYLLQEVVNQLVKDGQAVPAAALTRLAADPIVRSTLYDNLKACKKTVLFPKAYLTQSRFAESAVYDAADENDDAGTIDKIVFLSKKTAAFQGKTYSWYLYKVSLTGDDGPSDYLGIAGGYDPAAGSLKPKKDEAGVYWDEHLDATNINALFKAYLKAMNVALQEPD